MSLKAFRKALLHKRVLSEISDHNISMRNASGKIMQVFKVVNVACKFKGKLFVSTFVVSPDLQADGIIGMNIIREQRLALDVLTDKVDFVAELTAVQHLPQNTSVKVLDQSVIQPRHAKQVRLGLFSENDQKVLGCHEVIVDLGLLSIQVTTDQHGNFKCFIPNAHTHESKTLHRGDHMGTAASVDQWILFNETAAISSHKLHMAKNTHEVADVHRPITKGTLEYDRIKNLMGSIEAPVELMDQYVHLMQQNIDAFADGDLDLGRTKELSHSIQLKDQEPVYTQQFRLPHEHLKVIKDNVMSWLKVGIIEKSNSKFNSPIFCVPKKGGNELRVVLDYRKLNMKSLPDKYSIRTIDDCITTVGHAESRVFSCLDLTSGFWQMTLEPNSRKFTAFTIPGLGQYQWVTSPMGLMGCPASFSRLMEFIMHDAQNVITYIDDVLVHSKSHMDHFQHLGTALQKIRKAGLKLNPNKCVFGASQVQYLGHTLSANGISPGRDKAQAVADAPPPSTIKQVESFVGLCNYFRYYIKDFAIKAAPLFKLTRKDCEWKGGALPEDAMQAFCTLRNAIISKPVLDFPKRNGQYHLYVDAARGDDKNEGGLGAVLMQSDFNSGKKTVVGYASRRLIKHEKNYPAFLLELAAAVYGMEYFEHHLTGRSFHMYTDHKPLTNLSCTHKKTLANLQNKLQTMFPEFRYVQGKDNNVADFLSRYQGLGVHSIDTSEFKIITLQNQDKEIANLMVMVKRLGPNGEPVKLPGHKYRYKLLQGALLIEAGSKQSASLIHGAWRVLLPKTMHKEVVKEAHNALLAGHGGHFKTAARIKQHFYWQNMDKDIENHVKACQTCQKASKTGSPPPPLQPLPMPDKPNDRVHIDLFGPLKTPSNAGNKYVAVMTDAFTKLVRLAPIPDKEADTVARTFLDKYIYVHGVPLKVLTDGGLEFCNELQAALLKSLQIKHSITTPHHPQTNAQAEIFNKTMANFLKKAIEDAKASTLDWELYLGPLMFSYNTAVNKSTLVSPFHATFGYDPRVPLWDTPEDLLQHDSNIQQPSTADKLHQIRKAQWTARQLVHHNGQAAKEEQARYFDKANNVQLPDFKPGDKVWCRIQPKPGTNPKLHVAWEEGVVKERLSSATFKVSRPNRQRKKLATLNVQQLKPRTEEQQQQQTHTEGPQGPVTRSMTAMSQRGQETVEAAIASIFCPKAEALRQNLIQLVQLGYTISVPLDQGAAVAPAGHNPAVSPAQPPETSPAHEQQQLPPPRRGLQPQQLPASLKKAIKNKMPAALKRLLPHNKSPKDTHKKQVPTPDQEAEPDSPVKVTTRRFRTARLNRYAGTIKARTSLNKLTKQSKKNADKVCDDVINACVSEILSYFCKFYNEPEFCVPS